MHRDGSEVVVAIRDTGIGIPANKLASIFEIFSQVDPSLERSQGGLGIGLHLVKRLAEMHGGRIDVMSDGAGRGSTFTLRLPLTDAAEVASAELLPAHESPGASVPARRILVVDDNLDAAEMLATLLQMHRHQTQLAHDGAGALAAGRMVPARGHFAGYRTAADEWLRRLSTNPRAAMGSGHGGHRADRLGPGIGPTAISGFRL